MKLAIASLCALVLGLASAGAQAADLSPIAELKVPKNLTGHKDKPAEDLSGMACAGVHPDGGLRCVVVDDQDAHAQEVRLTGDTLLAGRTIALDKAPAGARGSPKTFKCKELGKEGEIDGEGVAFDGGFFYVAGSHGCGRNNGKFKLSAFQIARFKLGPDGAATELVRTYRAVDLLAKSLAHEQLGLDLKTEHGLNIEAIAVRGDDIYLGLRGPGAETGKRQALIVRGSVGDLFAAGDKPAKVPPKNIEVPLASGLGIRDMAALPDGRLLLLTGPETESPQPYALTIFDAEHKCLASLGELKDRAGVEGRAKAEGVALLGPPTEKARLVVVYDGLVNGGGQVYEVALPRGCPSLG